MCEIANGANTVAAFIVFELQVSDMTWGAEYKGPTGRLVEKHGGRYLAASSDLKKVEGGRALPNITVILEFPSQEAAEAFHSDPDYQPLIALRNTGSSTEATIVPGMV